MAKDLNRALIIGRLGRDPQLRFVGRGGAACATFSVASNTLARDETGALIDATGWLRVVAWRELAERCGTLLVRGTRVYVEGRVQTRRWNDDVGQPHEVTEIVADDVIVLAMPGGGRMSAAVFVEPEALPANVLLVLEQMTVDELAREQCTTGVSADAGTLA